MLKKNKIKIKIKALIISVTVCILFGLFVYIMCKSDFEKISTIVELLPILLPVVIFAFGVFYACNEVFLDHFLFKCCKILASVENQSVLETQNKNEEDKTILEYTPILFKINSDDWNKIEKNFKKLELKKQRIKEELDDQKIQEKINKILRICDEQ